jgi:hypothetical protein
MYSATQQRPYMPLIYSHWSDRTQVNFYDARSLLAAVEAARIEAQYHTNAPNLGPIVKEALGVPGVLGCIGARVLRMLHARNTGSPASSSPGRTE